MKKSEIRFLFLEIVAILFMLFSIFYKKSISQYLLIIFLGILFFTALFISSFEKERAIEKKAVIRIVCIYTLAFLIIIYGLGLFVGYVKTSYSLKIISIIKNLFPVVLLIVIEELLRYHIGIKGQNKKIILILLVFLSILIDISLSIHLYNPISGSKMIRLITVVIFPSAFKNVMLTYLSIKYGYKVCLVYQLITNVYLYTMPIFPNLSIYLESIIMVLLPLFIGITIYLRFKESLVEERKDKSIGGKIAAIIIISITMIMIGLYSNLFPYTIAVIGSGSMVPTLEVGDMIFFDKTYQNHLQRLKVGQILVFKIEDRILTHRIVKIDKKNGKYYLSTKGDRKGQAIDSWIVTNEDIIGIVKFKIPKIGYPSVWLNRLMEE